MKASTNKYESSIINKTITKQIKSKMKTFTTFQRSAKHQYNNYSVASFKGRGENSATYLTAAGCQEQVRLYEEVVVPYFQEQIQNEEGELKNYEEWLEALEQDNAYIKETFAKAQKEYAKFLKTVPEDVKPFLSLPELMISRYNLPKPYKSVDEAIIDVKQKIEQSRLRRGEAKAKLRLMTELYNKAKKELELFNN